MAYAQALGFTPQESGVYRYLDGTRWVAHHISSDGTATSVHTTEEKARAWLAREESWTG